MTIDPIIPDYTSACLSNIVPALLEHPVIGSGWLPDEVLTARKVVLLLLDGLGYEKFKISEQKGIVPNLEKMNNLGHDIYQCMEQRTQSKGIIVFRL